MPPPLRVRTLGAFQVWRGEAPIPAERWRARTPTALFACLLSAPKHLLLRDQVMEALWPETDPVVARHRLRTAAYELRRLLDEPGAPRSYLHGDRASLALAPCPGAHAPDDWLDADLFSARAAHALAGQDSAACAAALALYTGEYLPDEPYSAWALPRRVRLHDRYLALLAHQAHLCREQGRDAEAIACLERALDADRCQEQAARSLMELLAAAGRRAEALQVYQRLAAALHADLDLAPAAETEAIRRHLLARPTNLPAPLGEMVGRDDELATLLGLPAGARLLTLTGSAGCGKTRLALELAGIVLPEYRHGAWLLDLAPLRDAESALHALAALFAVEVRMGQAVLTAVTEALDGRHVLLVLDNCEHLAAACGRIARALLAGAPDVRILATSRERLGMAEETVWRVPSLSVPPVEARPSVEAVRRSGAGQLLVTRARAHRPSFALGAANAGALARICRRLDGIPLALELAAGRLALLEPEALADRLDTSFAVLGGNRAAPARHQTLRAALDWSYRLLTGEERALLQRLSIFAGPWTVDAAEQICAGEGVAADQVLTLLESLLAKSLITPADPGRYRLLEAIRQYGYDLLAASGAAPLFQTRRLAWCVALAEAALPAFRGSEQERWLARLDREHENLLHALVWSIDAAHPLEVRSLALRLAGALAAFWQVRGYLTEGRHWLTRALAIDAGVPPTVCATALDGLSWLALQTGAYDTAEAALARSMAARLAAGDTRALPDRLRLRANLAHLRRDHEQARLLYTEALALARQVDDRWEIAGILGSMGLLEHEQGRSQPAMPLLKESLRLFRDLGDQRAMANQLSNLGLAAMGVGEQGRAEALLEEALALYRRVGNTHRAANQLLNLGVLAEERDDLGRADALYQEALEEYRRLNDKWGVAAALTNVGSVAHRVGDADRAVALLEEGLLCFVEIGDPQSQRECLELLAALAAEQGEARRATLLYAVAAALRASLAMPALNGVLHPLRSALGDEFGILWARGGALPVAEALAAAPTPHALIEP